jgi:hypothetical protein
MEPGFKSFLLLWPSSAQSTVKHFLSHRPCGEPAAAVIIVP